MNTLLMSDIRSKSVGELHEMIEDLSKSRFKLRMQSGSDSAVKTHHFRQIRKNIARIKTFLAEGVEK